jgi:hypothetical protein
MNEVLELISALKSNAERERQALRSLDSRALLELAAQADGLARRLGAAMSRVGPEQLKDARWRDVRARAAELKALLRANATVASRSLDVVRALRKLAPPPPPDAPAFVSRHA